MAEDPIREAFLKAKQDIFSLQKQILDLKRELDEIKRTNISPTESLSRQTDNQTVPTVPTNKLPLEASESQNFNISTGNRGVPTDRQTIRQTDINAQKFVYSKENSFFPQNELIQKLGDLDSLRETLFKKFSSLTNQEFLVYASIYQYSLEGKEIDYSFLSNKLSLSQSSIRDYVQGLTKKQIPLNKLKKGNKKVYLSVPKEILSTLSLDTLVKIREK